MSESNFVHLEDCTIRRKTDFAFLVGWNDEEYWLPKSQIDDADRLEVGDDGVTVSITEWLAEQKGIEVDD